MKSNLNSLKKNLPHASDILYGNPTAMTNHLKIFWLMKLSKLPLIDLEPFLAKQKPQIENEPNIRVTTYYSSCTDGIERKFNLQDSRVTIEILDHNKVAQTDAARSKNRLIFNDFPFKLQNLKAAQRELEAHFLQSETLAKAKHKEI